MAIKLKIDIRPFKKYFADMSKYAEKMNKDIVKFVNDYEKKHGLRYKKAWEIFYEKTGKDKNIFTNIHYSGSVKFDVMAKFIQALKEAGL